ncbi:hypothetical protein IMZ48_45945, partial [Candidatus Bathyarchaeota archaeon]|nr:hypothetical protein [Candidatus Bathyarchaeota archaeon]
MGGGWGRRRGKFPPPSPYYAATVSVANPRHQLFCQNLSLFAKLFLDNKSVFFDVTGFNYFLLVFSRRDPTSPASSPAKHHICGFFSKEKLSWDNNNLACILVFPPWQRKGLGSLLMGVSYEISRREGVMGGPEKPISELGRKGYGRFWAGEIARWVLSAEEAVVDVEECSEATWIVPEDCLAVLRDMGVVEEDGLGPKKVRASDDAQEGEGEGEAIDTAKEELVPRVRITKEAVRAWVARQKVGLERACDPEGFAAWYMEELGRKAAAAK